MTTLATLIRKQTPWERIKTQVLRKRKWRGLFHWLSKCRCYFFAKRKFWPTLQNCVLFCKLLDKKSVLTFNLESFLYVFTTEGGHFSENCSKYSCLESEKNQYFEERAKIFIFLDQLRQYSCWLFTKRTIFTFLWNFLVKSHHLTSGFAKNAISFSILSNTFLPMTAPRRNSSFLRTEWITIASASLSTTLIYLAAF